MQKAELLQIEMRLRISVTSPLVKTSILVTNVRWLCPLSARAGRIDRISAGVRVVRLRLAIQCLLMPGGSMQAKGQAR